MSIVRQLKKILPLALLLLPTSLQVSSLAANLPESKPGEVSCTTPLNSNKVALNLAVSKLVQVASWVSEVDAIVQTMNHNLAPQLAAYFNPSVWPKISDRATKAKVPVFMYHDILPEKEVFFDVTVKELEQHFSFIKEQGLTPISFDQLVTHLRTGLPLPEKPIMLTFDDGYGGHYEYVYTLLKKYGYPAVFSVYTSNMGKDTGRTHVSWEQLKEMAANPLVTIAAHSVTHPKDLRVLSDERLKIEIEQSKQILEDQLGIPIRYFTYPEGKYDERVAKLVERAGYKAALTMSDTDERFAGESESMLAISRFGQSRLAQNLVNPESSPIAQPWGGAKLPNFWGGGFDFNSEVQVNKTIINETNFTLISGGRPVTIHAKSRYQVPEILAGTEAIAAVDGGFFSLKFLDSNVMIGPVLSQINNKFVPGYRGENPKLRGRPLVLISPQAVKFIGFDPELHNTLEGVEAAMPNVTDTFVAAAWLVKDNQPQSAETFGSLFDYDAIRHRAFWGISQAGQPTVGVSNDPIDSVSLGSALAKAGLRDAVMLDSGASTSLAYKGESLVGYTPRPVPHVVALIPPSSSLRPNCAIARAIK
ncbi:MAG: polysaccharide deacetylase family protein [Chroococcus sp. CMT-3BRIN-NPC107]|nr:polysaccharide deacetylase family protein [Chroococcus sp. CMT-3BRIN-NPC107]